MNADYDGRQYVGIDLHRRRSVLVRMTEAGEQLEAVRIVNDRDRLAAVMANAGVEPEVVLEATYGWYWAADALAEMGARVHLAHPLGVKWQDALFFFISTKFMPVAASIIPVFLLLRTLGLLDNLWALGVLYIGINLPLAVWMMRSFFSEVPRAVVEAAQIDGAGYNRELWQVSLPIVAPGAAAAALICFIFAWNEYFLANLLTAVVARTTPPFLGSFIDGRGQFLAVLSAACTLAVLPVVVAGWLAQKRLVRGLAMGAVK